MKIGLALLLFIGMTMPSFGAVDTTYMVSPRHFDAKEIEAYQANPDFSYVHESEIKHWWSGIYDWLIDVLSDWFTDKSTLEVESVLSVIFEILIWGTVLVSIGLLAHSLYRSGYFGVIGRTDTSIDLSYQDLEEKVLETDWQVLLDKAVSDEQYTVAIRLLFLQLLQNLDQEGQIKWHKSKSIRDYQREVAKENKTDFSTLASYYQYSWFGSVSIDHAHFGRIEKDFELFNQEINVG